MVTCEKCEVSYHKECVEPPLRRLPRSPWICPTCSDKKRKHSETNSRHRHEENGFNSGESNIAFEFSGVHCHLKSTKSLRWSIKKNTLKSEISLKLLFQIHLGIINIIIMISICCIEGHNINVIGFSYSQRRCAARASRKIHAFARLLRDTNSRSPNYNETGGLNHPYSD